jgi:CHAT domain-containing protein/tetratricopeptide (TPR) repeat protein
MMQLKTLGIKSGLILAVVLFGVSPAIAESTPIAQAQQTDRQAAAARLLQQGIQLYQQNQPEAAIAAWETARKIFREMGDQRGEASALNNLGVVYLTLARYEDVIAVSNQALPILRQVKDRSGEANVLTNLGAAYSSLSRYEQAIAIYNQALQIAREIKDRNIESGTLNNLGIAYLDLARYEDALTVLNQALPIFRQIQDRNGEAMALMNRATAYQFLARPEAAIAAYSQALAIFREIKDRSREAATLMNRGIVYRKLARYEEALTAFNQALPIFRQVKDRNGEAMALMNRGTVYSNLSRYQDAVAAYNEALPIFREIKDRSSEVKTLHNLGFVQSKARQLPQAEQSLRSAIAVSETIRLDRLSEENKISFFESQAISYRNLQAVLIAQNQPEAALTISEWGRAKALVERLSQQLQPNTALTGEAPKLSTLQQIARSQNATLVEYSIFFEGGREKQLYIWVIQPDGKITFRQVAIADVLPKQCASISQLIGNSRSSIGVRSPEADWLVVDATTTKNPCAQSDSETNFKALHQLLIEPIATLLPKDPNQQVVFIPDQALFLVPFPALKDSKGKYLIEKHTIRTASSIQLLDKTRALKSRPKGKGALIVGNPFMPNDPTSIQPKQLASLPNAEAEAIAIAPLFNTKAITGQNGTKNSALQKMVNANVIHLATHGSFYDRNGFKSWLALAPSANDTGILTAEEVAQLNLSADLVVLSACDTGRGRVTGDGVIGLSRSFIAAGVPSVIVSLWSVPDAPTAELMKEFYQQLQRNPNKAQALRQAMLKMLRSHPEPKNWAAFTLIGES